MTVRFGLIGYGLFGRHHAAAIAKSPHAELAAIAAPSDESRGAAREEYPQAQVFASAEELLAGCQVDAIDVVAPNHLHSDIGQAAISAGKHLFIEKPMCTELVDCDRLLTAAAEKNLQVAVNHELRVSDLWGEAKQLIVQGVIGRPRFAMIELSRFPYRPGAGGWRYDESRVGSWILEEPIHFFDLARWFLAPCGEPASVFARASSRDASRPQLQDNFSATMSYQDGAYALVSQTLAAFEHHVTAKITGEYGCIWAYWSAADARSGTARFELRYGLGDQIEEVKLPAATGELIELRRHVDRVALAIESGQLPPCTGQDGRWSTLLCLAAEESVRRREEVNLDAYAKQAT